MEWLVGADLTGAAHGARADQGSLGHPAENIAAAAATAVTGTVPAGTEGCRRQGSGQPAGGGAGRASLFPPNPLLRHRGVW